MTWSGETGGKIGFRGFQWDSKTDYAPVLCQQRYANSLVNWSALCDAARTIRGLTCNVEEVIKFGGVHMIRLLTFEDNLQWIARIRMPRISIVSDGLIPKVEPWTEQNRKAMKAEIDAMLYIREHSDIPVPKAFGYGDTQQNPVGTPYVFMECIYGNAVTDLASQIPDIHKTRLRDAIADFQVITLHRKLKLTFSLLYRSSISSKSAA